MENDPRCVRAVCEAEKKNLRVSFLTVRLLPVYLDPWTEAIRTTPGHAYEGQELASEYNLDQGQDLLASPKEEPQKEEPSKQEQKELNESGEREKRQASEKARATA
jgi:hypothetical protein